MYKFKLNDDKHLEPTKDVDIIEV